MIQKGTKIIGYARVSTREQGENGHSLDHQRRAIESEADRRGWLLSEIYADVATGKDTRRPQLQEALAELSSGRAEALVVTKIDRLSRSVADFASILDRAKREGWSLSVLDLGVDTSTPNGRMIANVIISLAEWEREIISTRTKEGLAETKRKGTTLGRISTLPDDVRARILREHRAGKSYNAIARDLNHDHVPTSMSGKAWYPTTIKKIVMAARR